MSNGRRGGARQGKSWEQLPSVSQSYTVATTIALGGLAFEVLSTVLRMIGEYLFCPDAAPVAQDACLIAVGIGVVSTDAAILGATALPDPVDEPDYPWLYWGVHPYFAPDTGTGSTLGAKAARIAFDVKSMRKVTTRQTLQMVGQYVDISGVPPVQFIAATTRVLVGLH